MSATPYRPFLLQPHHLPSYTSSSSSHYFSTPSPSPPCFPAPSLSLTSSSSTSPSPTHSLSPFSPCPATAAPPSSRHPHTFFCHSIIPTVHPLHHHYSFVLSPPILSASSFICLNHSSSLTIHHSSSSSSSNHHHHQQLIFPFHHNHQPPLPSSFLSLNSPLLPLSSPSSSPSYNKKKGEVKASQPFNGFLHRSSPLSEPVNRQQPSHSFLLLFLLLGLLCTSHNNSSWRDPRRETATGAPTATQPHHSCYFHLGCPLPSAAAAR